MRRTSLETAATAMSNRASDDELRVLAQRFREEGDEDVGAIAALTRSLAMSGAVERFSSRTADIASTGGPSSLTTLVCPLYLVAAGWTVPKLTVRGRPAGGIDVLETIPGYRISATIDEVREWLRSCGYAHLLADTTWAPLDARLFGVRQRSGLQNVPALVVASILSKKLALGLTRAAVEIRYGPFGNLGDDHQKLTRAVWLFKSVAHVLGIECSAQVTGDGTPYQPFIGRGEALVALRHVFENTAGDELRAHIELCRALCSTALGFPVSPVEPDQLRDIFAANLETQGTSYESFIRRVDAVTQEHRSRVHATSDGQLVWDLAGIRTAICQHQVSHNHRSDAAGVELLVLGGFVPKGTAIAEVRGSLSLHEAIIRSYTLEQPPEKTDGR